MRKYLPTLAELIDRLGIVTLKSIKLNNKEEYEKEASDIMHDLHEIMKKQTVSDWGKLIRAIQIGMLANETIWQNETLARKEGNKQSELLPFTHSVNGIRMRAGNEIVNQAGGRKDLNLDRVDDVISAKHGYNWEGLF